MKKEKIDSLVDCNEFLKENHCFANGKNVRVEYLYATAAKSRWCYENLWGIYLAKPEFSWMALWMAITSRPRLKKRQTQYVSPNTSEGDWVGHIRIFNPLNLRFADILCEEAYLYLFDYDDILSLPRIDISEARGNAESEKILISQGLRKAIICRRGKEYEAWISESRIPLLVSIDEWQAALINIEKLYPQKEIIVSKKAIEELSARIHWLPAEVGENYLVK